MTHLRETIKVTIEVDFITCYARH